MLPLADLAPRSNWVFLLGILVLVGWIAGGFLTATLARFGPVAHATVVALMVWGGWQIVAGVRGTAGGVWAVLFNGLFSVGAAQLGGLYGARRKA